MHEVNVAFERLKATIPHHRLKQIDEKKDTKITTLRCAITYINSLRYTHSINSKSKKVTAAIAQDNDSIGFCLLGW